MIQMIFNGEQFTDLSDQPAARSHAPAWECIILLKDVISRLAAYE